MAKGTAGSPLNSALLGDYPGGSPRMLGAPVPAFFGGGSAGGNFMGGGAGGPLPFGPQRKTGTWTPPAIAAGVPDAGAGGYALNPFAAAAPQGNSGAFNAYMAQQAAAQQPAQPQYGEQEAALRQAFGPAQGTPLGMIGMEPGQYRPLSSNGPAAAGMAPPAWQQPIDTSIAATGQPPAAVYAQPIQGEGTGGNYAVMRDPRTAAQVLRAYQGDAGGWTVLPSLMEPG